MTGRFVVEMKNISKTFPGVKALDNVSLQVRAGEVHALVGENGAGKSTLMKILSGLHQPNSGEILFNGKNISISSPAVSIQTGIAMIYQELSPVLDMTVAENIFLGREPMRKNGLFVDFGEMNRLTEIFLEEYRLNIRAQTKMNSLSTAQKQMIEIIKAVSLKSSVIVMDEPSSSLTDEEVRTLFDTIKSLRRKDVSIIYISHRMEEIFEIADRVTVLRDGSTIGTSDVKDLDKNSLIAMMVGRKLDSFFPKEDAELGDVVLSVKSLTRIPQFRDISFEVRKGEILGFYGLIGAGRSEVMRALFGIDSLDKGEICLKGSTVTISEPEEAIRKGIAMVTEDRKELGLILCRSIKENIVLTNLKAYSSGPFVDKQKEEEESRNISHLMKTKMSGIDQLTRNLSGGNQQKVVLSKWLITNPDVLILDEPTRGIDVAAKAEIHLFMSRLAREGKAIIMISSELPEIIGMSDRVLVMGDGKIKGEFYRGNFTQDQLLTCALGGKESA